VLTKSPERLKMRLKFLIFLFIIFSNQWISNSLLGMWEEKRNPAITKEYDCSTVILLGGFSVYDFERNKINFQASSDRVLQTMSMLSKGTIDRILISSGSGFVTDTTQKESIFVRNYLLGIGYSPQQILIDSISRNTKENAIESKKVLSLHNLEDKTCLLVTSAFHMRRAKACFKKNGIKVIPYPTDFKSDLNLSTYDMFVPSIKAIEKWNILIHEVVGFSVYKILDYA